MYRSIWLRQSRNLATLVILVGALPALAGWQGVYQTDFSEDPGWITNSPTNYYWRATQQDYYARQIDGTEQYAYVPLPLLTPGLRWRVEYEIHPLDYTWAGNGRVSLTDPSMSVVRPPFHEFITLDFNNGDGGNWLSLYAYTPTGGNGGHFGHFVVGREYKARFEWDPVNATVCAWVWDSDGLVAQTTLSGVGPFTAIDRLALSTVDDQYAPGATGQIAIDNLAISQVPEPGTLLAFAVLGLPAMRRSRGC